MPHALIVDDNAATLHALVKLVQADGFTTAAAPTVDQARMELANQMPDVVLADLNLPDGSGMSLLDVLDGVSGPAVVVITGEASVDTAVESFRRGVTDYLIKPLDVKRLHEILQDVSRTARLPDEIGALKAEQTRTGRFKGLVGHSEPMIRMCDLIGRIAPTSASVLISGESGSGKDVVAQTIHELSRRRHGPYVPVNCGAISPALMESELFGHEKGSFTGADRMHKGCFERASRGTLFLDEITEMPIELQVKLLRVLETGSLMRVGGEKPISVDVRILAASNRDVQQAMRDGKLREDLFYRLKVFQLNIAPLRERLDDIVPLAQFFLDELEHVEGKAKRFSREALHVMTSYEWPGNVRELKNVVQSAYILGDTAIDVAHLPDELREPDAAARPDAKSGVLTVSPGVDTIADVERRLIMATLHECGGDKLKAAGALGISLKTLYNRLNRYQKERPEDGGQD